MISQEAFVREAAARASQQAIEEWNAKERKEQVVYSDIEFSKEFDEFPVVRGETYPNKKHWELHAVYGYREFPSELVPVYMQGSLGVMRENYNRKRGHKAGLEHAVIERYLRKIKFTSFSRNEINDVVSMAMNNRRDFWQYQTWGCVHSSLGAEHLQYICYLQGVRHCVYDKNKWNLLKNMYKVQKKLAGINRKAEI